MGSKESKEKHSAELSQMSAAVHRFPKLITKGIKHAIESLEDQVVIKYVDLKDTAALEANVEQLFSKSSKQVQEYVVDTATEMYRALSTTKEMKDIKRTYHHQKRTSFKDKIYGLEVHYCMRGTDQLTWISPDSIELMIAYEVVLYLMEGDATDYPDQAEVDCFGFNLGSLEHHKGLEFITLLYYS